MYKEKKIEKIFYSTGDVAKIMKVNVSKVRFWEKEFNIIKPKIFAGKRRYYDNKSIEVLKKIKFLLKNQGLTIKGAKKILSTSESFRLDDLSNKHINVDKNIVLKSKISKISKLVKEIKGLK